MALIKFITHDGKKHEVNASLGDSIMYAAVDNGIDSITAECGGSCSCATCHCYIDEAWVSKVTPADEFEIEMLDATLEPKNNSRLCCQIEMTAELDGIVVHLPESQI